MFFNADLRFSGPFRWPAGLLLKNQHMLKK
jgi:hypothetical protein